MEALFGDIFSSINKNNQSYHIKELSPKTIKTFVLCIQCHDKSFFNDPGSIKNNGLPVVNNDIGLGGVTKSSLDYNKFKVPTLRNILYSAPYMHDGRFKTIDEVIDYYNDDITDQPTLDPLLKDSITGKPIKLFLGEGEKKELKYLFTLLTDSTFLGLTKN
jgi:cytochrome c peroxidase